MTPPKRKILYEGSSKIIFEAPEPENMIIHYKDDIIINEQKQTIIGKGVINNRISEYLLNKLSERNISTHLIKSLNMREQLVKKLDLFPVRVIVRNIASGCICKRFNIEEGIVFARPIIEFTVKSTKLNYPIIGEDCILGFGWADVFELDEIKLTAMRANDFLSGLFLGAGIRLVDFKLEFGKILTEEGERLIIADEISPDTCRLWDIKTNQRLDKDRLEHKLDKPEEAYLEVARRLGVLTDRLQDDQESNVKNLNL